MSNIQRLPNSPGKYYAIFIPYVSGLSEDLRRKYDIYHHLHTSMTSHKGKDVDPLLSRAGGVYKIPCSCGNEYIREIKRAV